MFTPNKNKTSSCTYAAHQTKQYLKQKFKKKYGSTNKIRMQKNF